MTQLFHRGGVFNFSTNNWSGRIQGAIYGSDHQLITEYVFNGSASTNTNLTGDVQFNDESHLGGGIITGDAIFNTTYYDSTAPSGGVFTISTNGWSGQVVGTVYGSDDVAITEYVFNDSAFNSGTINGDVTFNGDNSSNYGTITGTKTRRYTSDIAPTQNLSGFTVVADGAVVNITNATYSPSTTFVTENGGSFVGDIHYTYYFNNDVDDSPTELGNYWGDSGFTTPATQLPVTDRDSVIVTSGSTYRGDITFFDEAYNAGTVIGDAVYETSSYNSSSGIVQGTATFNGESYNEGSVTNAVFNDNSYNQGIFDTATFNDSSYNTGAVEGEATFNDSSYNYGTITGAAIFVDDFSENSGSATTLIRKYTVDIVPSRDFTGWTIIADGAGVNLTSASYDNSTIFQEINGGVIVYPEKSILSFLITGGHTIINQIDYTITVAMPSGSVLTNLHPTISYAGSSISPLAGLGQDFTNPVTYTVTSSNSVTQDYTVTVTIDATAPTLISVTPITTPTTDTTPQYIFSSSEAGTITYGGSCSSNTTNAQAGNNTIFFNTLALGTYSNCTISVTDNVGNVSTALTVPTFVIAEGVTISGGSGGSGGGSHSSGGGGGGTVSTTPVQTTCPPGHIFSVLTGQRCTSYITTPHLIPSPYHFTRSLSLKMNGEDVRQLQIYLNTHGYPIAPSPFPGSTGKETTLFGPATKAALIKFQKGNKIVPSIGFFGPVTRAFVEGA